MPSPLTRYNKDPEGKGRGAGWYYRRGNTKYKWSKYSEQRDSKIKALGYDTHKIGLPVKHRLKHTIDGNVKRR